MRTCVNILKYPSPVVLTLCQHHLEGLLNEDCQAPHASDSVSLEWGIRICVSNQFPGDADNGQSKDHSLRAIVLQ